MAESKISRSSSSSATTEKPSTTWKRKKKFSPKVRTGCDNCKKRRIKCDERKPECQRCLRTGIQCAGYTIPQPKVFQPSSVPTNAGAQFNIIDARRIKQDTDFEFSRRIPENGLKVITKSYQALHNLRPSSFPYNTPDDNTAFGFYISWTSPMLAAYGPNGDFWKKLVPQFTFHSPAVRQLLLAAVMVDGQWLSTARQKRSDCAPRALMHYITALKAIASGQTSKVEALVSALMAWTIEAMLLDYRSGVVHLQAARRLLIELEEESALCNNKGTCELVSEDLGDVLRFAEGYNTLMLDTKPPLFGFHNPCPPTNDEFQRLRAIRGDMSRRLTKVHQEGIGDIPQFVQFIRDWEDTDRSYRYASSESQTLKEASHLVFNIACALLPESEVHGLSQSVNQKTVDFVLTRVHAAVNERDNLPRAEHGILDETLSVVLKHLFELFPDGERWAKHETMISRLSKEFPQVFEQTGILDNVRMEGKLRGPIERTDLGVRDNALTSRLVGAQFNLHSLQNYQIM